MTATTPTEGFPYAEPSDARGAGANAMRDLALAVEARVRNCYAYATVIGQVPLVNNTWTDVAWTAELHQPTSSPPLTVSGSTFTLGGTQPMLVLVGYTVGVFGTTKNSRLTVNGAVQPTTAIYNSDDRFAALVHTAIVPMSPGNTIKLSVMAGSGGSPVSYSDAQMYVVRL